MEIGFRKPKKTDTTTPKKVTYHEACHLCHGQKITRQPREILKAIPGMELVELTESNWCCGSAGVYNITQPETAAILQDRKIGNVERTNASVVATCNPGCHLQLQTGLKNKGSAQQVSQPVSLLAEAYRNEKWNEKSS